MCLAFIIAYQLCTVSTTTNRLYEEKNSFAKCFIISIPNAIGIGLIFDVLVTISKGFARCLGSS